jgi:predicted O-methyltransferase YrrM
MFFRKRKTTLENYNQNRMSAFDLAALEQLLNGFGRTDLRILEIGSWFGAGSTQILARYSSRMVCVDHWMGNDNSDHKELTRLHDVFGYFKKNTERFGDKIIAIKGASSSVCPILKDGEFDFVFIDGDHRYAQTVADIANCKRLVADGGVLSGHDCEARLTAENTKYVRDNAGADSCKSISTSFLEWHPGVILAVAELVPNAILFADSPLNIGDRSGYSTIWYEKAP